MNSNSAKQNVLLFIQLVQGRLTIGNDYGNVNYRLKGKESNCFWYSNERKENNVWRVACSLLEDVEVSWSINVIIANYCPTFIRGLLGPATSHTAKL
jgi:hypothetical protein